MGFRLKSQRILVVVGQFGFSLRELRLLCISAVRKVQKTLTAEAQRTRGEFKLSHYLVVNSST